MTEISPPLKRLIDNDLYNLFIKTLLEYKKYDGKKCPKCGLIQGLPNDKLGVRVWYCDWVYKKIERKFSKQNKQILNDVLNGMELKENKKK